MASSSFPALDQTAKSVPPKSASEVKPDEQHDAACAKLLQASRKLQEAARSLKEVAQNGALETLRPPSPSELDEAEAVDT
jgi:hypothetical protein